MNTKQVTEREIFDLVYGDKQNISIRYQDKPDFWITHTNQYKFGVEVAGLFKNEGVDMHFKNNLIPAESRLRPLKK